MHAADGGSARSDARTHGPRSERGPAPLAATARPFPSSSVSASQTSARWCPRHQQSLALPPAVGGTTITTCARARSWPPVCTRGSTQRSLRCSYLGCTECPCIRGARRRGPVEGICLGSLCIDPNAPNSLGLVNRCASIYELVLTFWQSDQSCRLNGNLSALVKTGVGPAGRHPLAVTHRQLFWSFMTVTQWQFHIGNMY